MYRRTKTYIAAEWSGDHEAVERLEKWNESNYWSLSFNNAHDLMQARDNSLNCSIKRSLCERLKASKIFVLIVGERTNTVTAGSCHHCNYYRSGSQTCAKGYGVDYRSYLGYECKKAVDYELKIVVLYNSTSVDRSKCPEALRYTGNHIAMKKWGSGGPVWDYQAVKNAIENA